MSEFLVYLRLGFEHISDLQGYDHIVFVVALCAIYSYTEWRNLLWLVTAFTIGHSVTLILATSGVVTIDADFVEILIPVTIVVLSVLDLLEIRRREHVEREADEQSRIAKRPSYWTIKYGLALFFGLIHGLGFSNFLRAVLGGGEQIAIPLFAFNIGLELGQILIVGFVLVISSVIIRTTSVSSRIWGALVAVSTGMIGIVMFISRIIAQ